MREDYMVKETTETKLSQYLNQQGGPIKGAL